MPESLLFAVDANPVLRDARERYDLFAGLPPVKIIEQGILVETTSACLSGEEYAVRSYVSPEIARLDFANRLPALVHGLGRQSLEQLVAYSPEDGVLVTKRQQGRPISAIGLDEAATMTQERFDDLADTIDFATRARVEATVYASNLLYSPTEGFSLVNYSLARDGASTDRTIRSVGQAMMRLGRKLPTFYSEESIRMREKHIRLVTQAGISKISQSNGRALIEDSGAWIDRCWSSHVIVDAK